jgi:O-acetyl-ADP-ribose deacetylase (regulator of RNase III)
MKIIFCDRNIQNLEALRNAFNNLHHFEFVQNNITSVKADCIVSPANSYGLMDGGVDRTINYSLNYISEKVKKIIQFRYGGEQPVGTCFIVPVENNQMTTGNYKYLAHTPTMRIPKDVSNTDNAYIAFRALLTELFDHNRQYNDINTIVMTSFCSGAGKMSPTQAAQQMRLAFDYVTENTPCTWEMAHQIDKMLDTMIVTKTNK